MKKSRITILLCSTSVIIGACGNAQTEAVPQSTAEVQNEDIISEVESSTEISTEDSLTQERKENALEKVNYVIDAYHTLLDQDNDFDNICQWDLENFSYNETQVATKDGNIIHDGLAEYAVLVQYYNNYVNNNQTYYDLEQWVSEQESSDAIKQMTCGVTDLETYDTNDYMMMEAVRVVPYLSQVKNIDLGEIEETTDYEISQSKSAYAYPIICDGEDLKLTAVFDENDRLMNIVSTDLFYDQGYVVLTWPTTFDFWGLSKCKAELDKVYDVTMDCYDEGYTTAAKVYFTDYDTFTSDDNHPAKDGYIWKTVKCYVYAGDENCVEHGLTVYRHVDDCNNNFDFDSFDKEKGVLHVFYNEEEYTDCEFHEEYKQDYEAAEQFGWDEAMYYEYNISILVPEGYNDFVWGVYNNHSFEYFSDATPENFIYFQFE